MVVDFIITRQGEGIHNLLLHGVYSAAYPLHDVSFLYLYILFNFIQYFFVLGYLQGIRICQVSSIPRMGPH